MAFSTFSGFDLDKTQTGAGYYVAYTMARPTSGITYSGNKVSALSLTKANIYAMGYCLQSEVSALFEADKTEINHFGTSLQVTSKHTLNITALQVTDFTLAIQQEFLDTEQLLLLINPDLITGNAATLASQSSPLTIAFAFDRAFVTVKTEYKDGDVVKVQFQHVRSGKLSLDHGVGQNLSATLS